MTPSVTDVAANGRLVRIAASQHGTKPSGQNGVVKNRRFCPDRPALPHIKGIGWTKTHDKTFAVLGGFWHSVA